MELVYYIEDDDIAGVNFIEKVTEKSINCLLRSRAVGDELSDHISSHTLIKGLVHQIPRKNQEDFEELKRKKESLLPV